MNPARAPHYLFLGFTYEADGKIDSYHILRDLHSRGDCDDFAITVLWLAANRSKARLFWWLLTRRAKIVMCRTRKGNLHVAAWLKNYGYSDNWFPHWNEELKHERIVAVPVTYIVFKLFLGLFFK